MVAENGYGVIFERFYEAKCLERFWPAVDDIAAEPQPVPVAVELDVFEQLSQFVITSLHVTDGICRHLHLRRIYRSNYSFSTLSV